MRLIGLTGGIATGKSTVSAMLAARGAAVVDADALAREVLVLGLPLAPLCRPDCAGLCQTCGADLNLGDCGCPPVDADPRWAALDALRPEP